MQRKRMVVTLNLIANLTSKGQGVLITLISYCCCLYRKSGNDVMGGRSNFFKEEDCTLHSFLLQILKGYKVFNVTVKHSL